MPVGAENSSRAAAKRGPASFIDSRRAHQRARRKLAFLDPNRREWAAHARDRGVAAIYEAAQLRGMGDRVLSWQNGERHMTDLAHVTQLLQDVAHRERLGLPALRDWLRNQREQRSGATERNRRLDSDANAVQVMTVFGAKGLQFPVVYLPFAFNRSAFDSDIVLFHDDGVRCLYIGGKNGSDFSAVQQAGRQEDASDDSRMTYVALTRAQAQVVAWWSPAFYEPSGGLSRLLRRKLMAHCEQKRPYIPALPRQPLSRAGARREAGRADHRRRARADRPRRRAEIPARGQDRPPAAGRRRRDAVPHQELARAARACGEGKRSAPGLNGVAEGGEAASAFDWLDWAGLRREIFQEWGFLDVRAVFIPFVELAFARFDGVPLGVFVPDVAVLILEHFG